MMLPWQKRPLALNSPRDLPGLALWLDSKDVSSLRNDAGAQPVTTDGIKLASDKSGNSSTNVLCLNGVAGNYASASDSAALSITGDIDVRAYIAASDYTPAATMALVAKYDTGANKRSYGLFLLATGVIQFNTSADGTVSVSGADSTVALGTADFAGIWVRVTKDVDNGAAGNTTTFYTSPDGATWTQLGNAVVNAGVVSIFNSDQPLTIGSAMNSGTTSALFTGNIYRAQIYNGIAGTLVFDFDPSIAAKLATTVTERSSNAATVTINNSGSATGARISGARDLYQGVAASQPILTIAAAGNYLTFDGSNDYLKAAAFALAQPTTVYFVGSQVTWTSNDYVYDGNTAISMGLVQFTGTPTLNVYSGNTLVPVSTLALATTGVMTGVFNGASSANRLNRTTAVTGNAGAVSANGFTLGATGSGSTGFANITASEVLVYSGAHDKATQDRVIAYLANRNRIALT